MDGSELRRNPDQFVLNAVFDPAGAPGREPHALGGKQQHSDSHGSSRYDHVLTGVPDNQWAVALEPGICLDFAPIGDVDLLCPGVWDG